jgi:hypothetical protein
LSGITLYKDLPAVVEAVPPGTSFFLASHPFTKSITKSYLQTEPWFPILIKIAKLSYLFGALVVRLPENVVTEVAPPSYFLAVQIA